jgi:hypothetical protein
MLRLHRVVLPAFLLLASLNQGASAQGTSRDAGYSWAKRLNIVDAKRCGGPTQAFVDGCQAYARQLAQRESFMPIGAYSSGMVGNRPHFYTEPVYGPIRSFE